MITFSKLGEYGRLGNQLFQYAAVRALCLENNYDLVLPDPETKSWHGQDCLLKNFNIPDSLFGLASGIQYQAVEEDPFRYDAGFWEIPDNADLVGFWQSLSYFDKHEDAIKRELTPRKEHMSSAGEYLKSLKEKHKKPIVSIHIRRGDMLDEVNKQHYGSLYEPDGEYFTYLRDALNLFPECCYLVFTGGKRSEESNSEDIEWCKKNLGIDAEYSEGTTMQDFCRMMLCDHSILSPATSFGWWAGYLSYSKDKKVVAPNNYHPDLKNFNHRQNFYHKEFILL
jgi:hypothetical protein